MRTIVMNIGSRYNGKQVRILIEQEPADIQFDLLITSVGGQIGRRARNAYSKIGLLLQIGGIVEAQHLFE